MQKFDPQLYPHLAALDEKAKNLLLSGHTKDWSTPRIEFEVSRIHPVYWMEEFGWIKPGEIEIGSGPDHAEVLPIPFKLNPNQLYIANKICKYLLHEPFQRIMVIVLKYRKAGTSTLFAAFDYWFMRFYAVDAFVIADINSHTSNIMDMIKLFRERDECGKGASEIKYRPPTTLPLPPNKRGMKLVNGALIEQDSGDTSNPGTSGTISVLHMSENAKWRDPRNAETSLINSVRRKGFAFMAKESTAFGLNKFAQDWEEAEKGQSTWEPIFITWLDMPDCKAPMLPGETLNYTIEERELLVTYKGKMKPEHVKWRRQQIESLGSAQTFKQDFPLNSREPFTVSSTNYFDVKLVQTRIDLLKFYQDWKEQGLEVIRKQNKYPDVFLKIDFHPRGKAAALARIEDDCVIPAKVKFHRNVQFVERSGERKKEHGSSYDGLVSYVRDPDARLEDGAALMFRPPVKHHKYIVIVDAAEGKKTSEYESDDSMIEVFDCFRKEQVLEWGGLFDEEMTADYAVRIAKVYNNALIVFEANNKCGGLLWGYIQKTGYRFIYHRESISGNRRKREPGWETRSGIKREVCGQFKLDFKNGDCLLHSIKTLTQMLFFIDKQGKLEAAEGHKDDTITCCSVGSTVISLTPALRQRGQGDDRVETPTDVNSYVQPAVAGVVSGSRSRSRDSVRRYL